MKKKLENKKLFILISFCSILLILVGITMGLKFFHKDYYEKKVTNNSANSKPNYDDEPLLGAMECTDNSYDMTGLGCCCGVDPPENEKPSTPTPSTPSKPSTKPKCSITSCPSGKSLVTNPDGTCYCEEDKEYPACYKDNNGTYVWGYYLGIYQYVSGVYDDNTCKAKNVACYRQRDKDGNYTYKWGQNPGGSYEVVSYISKESDCTFAKCAANITSLSQNGEATRCEDTVTLPSKYTNLCNAFFEIKCDNNQNTVTTEFNYDNKTIKVGQGFNVGAKITLNTSCTGTFDKDKWNTEYNKILDLIQLANESGDTKGKNWYNSIKNELESIVTAYKNSMEEYKNIESSKDKNNPTGKLKLKLGYKVIASYDFELDSKNKIVSDSNYNVTSQIVLKNNVKVENFTVNKKSVVNLIAPQVYVNKMGEEVSSTSKDKIDAGRSFLTSMDLEPGEYSLEITIDKLGNNQNLQVTNAKCNVTLQDNDIDYRIIDIANPFGITTHTPGINWANANYDFKNTINKQTWSSNSLYHITLSNNEIKKIQNDNAQALKLGKSPYTGLCEVALKDNVSGNTYNTSRLCNFIK